MSLYRPSSNYRRHFRPAINPEEAKLLAQRRQDKTRARIRADIEAARAKATVPQPQILNS